MTKANRNLVLISVLPQIMIGNNRNLFFNMLNVINPLHLIPPWVSHQSALFSIFTDLTKEVNLNIFKWLCHLHTFTSRHLKITYNASLRDTYETSYISVSRVVFLAFPVCPWQPQPITRLGTLLCCMAGEALGRTKSTLWTRCLLDATLPEGSPITTIFASSFDKRTTAWVWTL